MQEQNGITLVSLVLTIILMLILVGVTVKITRNGLLDKKDKAVNEYYSKEKNTTDKIKTIEDEWDGVIK